MACDTTPNYRDPRIKAAFERMVQDLLSAREANCHAPTKWTDSPLKREERRPGKVVPFASGRWESGQKSVMKTPAGAPATLHSNRPHPKRGTR